METVNASDSVAKRLTFLQGRSFQPYFSPDGTKLVFTASGRGRCDIYLMHADGSNLQCLTTGEGQYGDPVFSPDGAQIAYVGSHPFYEEIHDIHLMNADGTDQRILTTAHTESDPCFSPDGKQIAFVSGRDRVLEIYRMQVDGSDQQRLVVLEGGCDDPMFSPDGMRVAFRNWHTSEEISSTLCVMHPAGSALTRLSNSQGARESFHPKGDRIVFASNRNRKSDQTRRNWDLYCIRIEDGMLQRLTDNEARNHCPVFSPDGKMIVFNSDRDGFDEIYVTLYED